MEEKNKKKKLTLTVSSKKPYKVSQYTQSKGKTSVLIEKKPPRKWGGKKFQPKDSFHKPIASPDLPLKKPSSDNMNKYNWQKKHKENLTGTVQAHKPEGSLSSDSKKNMKKYETWKA